MNAVLNDVKNDAADAADVAAKAGLKIEREEHKLEKRLCREVGRAIVDFNMIEEGDKVMVCVSGGKDSYAMLDILLKLQKRAPIHFDLIAVNLDQKQPGFPDHILPQYLEKLGVPFHIETQDTYSIVKRVIPEGKTMCSLCSRLRRGILYRVAEELGATKIALGHHRDDMLQTFFLNMFFASRLKGMPPKLVSDTGKHVVRQPAEPAARAGRQHAARMGQEVSRPSREHVHLAAERRALAPDGRQAARLQGHTQHRHAGPGRRQGL